MVGESSSSSSSSLEVKVVRMRWGSESKLVTVWAGCPAWEMRQLLKGALGCEGPVALVGGETGLIVPLSVACRYPQTLEETSYNVLQADGVSPPPPPPGVEDGKPPEVEAVEDVDVTEEASRVDKLTTLISKFSRLLESSGRMTGEEASTIIELASRRDAVVLAAYSVAATEQNADYLASLLVKISKDAHSERGRSEHKVAERLLHVIDEMYANPAFELDMDRCRALQSCVLSKDPMIFAALDAYDENGDADELFDTLLRVAQRQPEEDDDDDDDGTLRTMTLVDDRRFAVFQECAKWLVDRSALASADAEFLLTKVRNGDRDVLNSFDQYAESSDLEAFLDTLAALAQRRRGDDDAGKNQTTQRGAAPFLTSSSSSSSSKKGSRGDLLEEDSSSTELVVLTECLAWLRDKKVITKKHAVAVLGAAKEADPRVQSAIDLYAQSNDLGKFLESLSVLARLMFDDDDDDDENGAAAERAVEAEEEVVTQARGGGDKDDDDDDDLFWEEPEDESANPYMPPPAAAKDDVEGGTYDDDDDDEETISKAQKKGPTEEEEDIATLLLKAPKPADDDVAVLEIGKLVECLAQDSKLREAEHDRLTHLLKTRDPRLLAAFDVYEESQDIDDLVDTLLRLARKQGHDQDDDAAYDPDNAKVTLLDDDFKNDEGLDSLDRDAVRHLPDPELDDDDDDDDTVDQQPDKKNTIGAPAPADGAFTTFLSEFEQIAAGQLSDVESAALELCAARDEDLLAGALRNYQKTLDKDALLDEFKAIAKQTIASTVGDDTFASDPQ